MTFSPPGKGANRDPKLTMIREDMAKLADSAALAHEQKGDQG